VVTQQLDERGQLVRVVDAAGAETRFVHDARGEVVERVDPRGARVLFERDALGRVVRQVDRNGDAVTTAYTPSGKLSAVTFPSAARGGAAGFRVEFGYDLLDRVVSMRDALGTAVNVYEAGSGRLIETTDSLGGRLRYAFDAAGRLVGTPARPICRRGVRCPTLPSCPGALARSGVATTPAHTSPAQSAHRPDRRR
jgi:YD repeat-containing protein